MLDPDPYPDPVLIIMFSRTFLWLSGNDENGVPCDPNPTWEAPRILADNVWVYFLENQRILFDQNIFLRDNAANKKNIITMYTRIYSGELICAHI